jgi:hypothetical protein
MRVTSVEFLPLSAKLNTPIAQVLVDIEPDDENVGVGLELLALLESTRPPIAHGVPAG